MTLVSFSYASAHCFVGARFFPATLATDDPCIADEMSLPTVAWFKTGDVPPASEVDIEVDISKRITEDFGVTIGDAWSHIAQPGNPTLSGFADLETTFQYQLLKDPSHELALLLGLVVDWGGTGNTGAGIGTSFSILTPTFYFGQGFGELPDTIGWARPLALTGQIGYQVPRLVAGESLGAICADAGVPAKATVFRWLDRNEEFRRFYALAREVLTQDFADEMLEIADDSTDDWIEYRGKDGKTRRVFNLDNILRTRLRIAARKWHLVGLMPNGLE
jgi:hypothetical protein